MLDCYLIFIIDKKTSKALIRKGITTGKIASRTTNHKILQQKYNRVSLGGDRLTKPTYFI